MSEKVRTARLSVVSNSVLIALKLVTGLITGSISIISEAIHSFIDLLAAIIAFFSVKISDTPPDSRHPYGHGKFENLSGVIEGILIFVAAGWIIFEAIKKILHPAEVESFGLGFVVMMISGIVNIFVSRLLYKTAKKTDSIALRADALHLSTDVFTSFGVALGLLIIWITGWYFMDPVIAIIVALFIIKEAYELVVTAYQPLLDVTLEDEEMKIIQRTIQEHLGDNMDFHQLRTRKAGAYRYVDLHLEVPGELTVHQSHQLCDLIEEEIKGKIRKVEVSIHVEPK